MNSLFTIHHLDDVYEISIRGFIICRISRYYEGAPIRQDVQFDDCPKEVQEKILDKITQVIYDF